MKTQILFWLSLFGFALALTSCASEGTSKQTAGLPTGQGTHYEWNDDGGSGPVKVRVNLSAQRAYVTRGGRQIGWCYVATGSEGRNTPAGTYRITEKIVDKTSNLYGWIENSLGDSVNHDAGPGDYLPAGCRYVAAPMPYWMRLTGYGIGMHAGYIPQPGVPASHGCIRLPKSFAPLLYEAVSVGTPVTIEPGSSIPTHSPANARSPKPAMACGSFLQTIPGSFGRMAIPAPAEGPAEIVMVQACVPRPWRSQSRRLAVKE